MYELGKFNFCGEQSGVKTKGDEDLSAEHVNSQPKANIDDWTGNKRNIDSNNEGKKSNAFEETFEMAPDNGAG